MTEWTPEEERVANWFSDHWWDGCEVKSGGGRIAACTGPCACREAARDVLAISAMQPRWRDVKTDPPPPNVSLLLFEPETPGRAGAIVVGMARWGWDNEVASNWSENPWATHWTPLPPAPEDKP